MRPTELSTLEIIRQQISELLCADYSELIERRTVIKEVLDSMLFVGLLVRIEGYFSIEISEATIYETGLTSIGDLADCIDSQLLIKRNAETMI